MHESIVSIRLVRIAMRLAENVEVPMLIHRYLVGCIAWCLITLFAGCATAPPATIPMNTLLYAEKGTQNRTLIVLLPGIRDQPGKYESQGFVGALRSRGLAADLVAVNAHFGYYTSGSVVERLKIDVVVPAQAQGYDKIWLVGISLGGLGSLLYSMHYPDDVEGILILGPYLGGRGLIEEISEAGGLVSWQPGDLSKQHRFRALWAWLKNYDKNSKGLPPLYLGYGHWDKFATAHSILAAMLPPERVYVTPGWHNWRTWKKLWDKVLDEEIFIQATSRSYAWLPLNGRAELHSRAR